MDALNAESDSARNRRGVGGKSKAVSAVAEVDSQRLPRPKRPLVLVHIPKTAGTSLTVVLLRNETRDAVKLGNVFKGGGGVELHPDYARKAAMIAQVGSVGLVTGHFPLGLADHLPGKWRPRYITFLREQVERALSHYFQIL